jgi:hypothetical protein
MRSINFGVSGFWAGSGTPYFLDNHSFCSIKNCDGRRRCDACKLGQVVCLTIPTTFVPKETQPRPGGALF